MSEINANLKEEPCNEDNINTPLREKRASSEESITPNAIKVAWDSDNEDLISTPLASPRRLSTNNDDDAMTTSLLPNDVPQNGGQSKTPPPAPTLSRRTSRSNEMDQDYKDGVETLPPPPAPTLSRSTSRSNEMQQGYKDGVETLPPVPPIHASISRNDYSPSLSPNRLPQESAANINPNENALAVPENYFDDLIEARENYLKSEEPEDFELSFLDTLTEEDLQPTVAVKASGSRNREVETIRVQPTTSSIMDVMDEAKLEATLSLRLKELEELNKRSEKEADKDKDKNKDINQESQNNRKRTRSRSRSYSPHKERRSNFKKQSGRLNIIPSPDIKPEPKELDYLPVEESLRNIKIRDAQELMATTPASEQRDNSNSLTIKEKRALAVMRATEALNLLGAKSTIKKKKEFLLVDTIKPLPNSKNFRCAQPHENPSPLCTNFNVKYKFNSTGTKIDLLKWGLESVPEKTKELQRLFAIDITRLKELQANSKCLLLKEKAVEQATQEKLKVEMKDGGAYTSRLYKTASTQTVERLSVSTQNASVQTVAASQQGIYWLDSSFDETDLPQQQTNVMLALKQLCTMKPSSVFWADELYKALRGALAIRRAEMRELSVQI